MNSFLSLRFAVMMRGGGKRFRNRVAPPRRRGVAGWSKQHIGPRHHGMRAPVQHVVANFTICDIGTPQLRVVCRASSRLVAVGTASGYTASAVLCAARTAAGRARVHVCVSVPAARHRTVRIARDEDAHCHLSAGLVSSWSRRRPRFWSPQPRCWRL